jgi:hypothetical protein
MLRAPAIDFDAIKRHACAAYRGARPSIVFAPEGSRNRTSRNAWIRHVAAWLAHQSGLTLSDIDRALSLSESHGLARNAVKRVNEAREVYPKIKAETDEIFKTFESE